GTSQLKPELGVRCSGRPMCRELWPEMCRWESAHSHRHFQQSVRGENVQISAQLDFPIGVVGQQIGLLQPGLAAADLIGTGKGELRFAEMGLAQAELEGVLIEQRT